MQEETASFSQSIEPGAMVHSLSQNAVGKAVPMLLSIDLGPTQEAESAGFKDRENPMKVSHWHYTVLVMAIQLSMTRSTENVSETSPDCFLWCECLESHSPET